MKTVTDYQILKDTYEAINRIEGKLDRFDERLSTVEMWRAELMARITMAVAVISFFFTMGWDWIKYRLR